MKTIKNIFTTTQPVKRLWIIGINKYYLSKCPALLDHYIWECVTEAGHFLNNQGRQSLLNWLADYGLTVHSSRVEDLKDMAAYMKKYPNVSKGKGADIADVALVFLANHLKSSHIFTVDRADFAVYRTKTGKPFTRLWVSE